MTKRCPLKKVLCIGLIIAVVVLLFVWIEFVFLPYIEARKTGAEIVSKRLLWPVIDDDINIPFMNGRAVVFNQGAGRHKVLSVVEADGRIYDVELPEGRRGLFGAFRSSISSPIIVIQDSPFDLADLGRYGPDTVFKIKIVEIQQDGHFKTETIKTDYFIGIHSISDDYLLGDRFKDINGESVDVPVLVSLKDLKVLDLLLFKEDILFSMLVDNTIIYRYWRNITMEQTNLYAYSLIDKSIKKIGEIRGPKGWTYYNRILAFADHLNGTYDIYYYNFSKNKGGLLLDSEGSQKLPFLYEDYLFWSDDRNANETGYDIYVKNLRTGEVKVLVNAPGDQLYPVYFHGYLYWTNNIYSNLADMWIYTEQPYVFRKKVELP